MHQSVKASTSAKGRKPISPERATYVQNQLSHLTVQLKYRASDGKFYNMDFAVAEGLYLITELIDADSKVRNRILAYLAHAGVIVDEQRLASVSQPRALPKNVQKDYEAWLEQGYSEVDARAMIEDRIDAIAVRVIITDVLKAIVQGEIRYGDFTNAGYRAMFNGKEAQQLKAELNTNNLRGATGLPRQARAFITIAEENCTRALNNRQTVTFAEACGIMRQCAEPLGLYMDAMEELTGISRVTGRPMLPSGA